MPGFHVGGVARGWHAGDSYGVGRPVDLMLNAIPDDTTIYIACGYTDLREQIDGLATVVVEASGHDSCV